MATITGKTKTGYAFEYDDRILTSWEYAKALALTQSGTDMEKVAASINAVEILVGSENMAGLLSHVKKLNDGYAPVEKIVAEFTDMLSVKNAKN